MGRVALFCFYISFKAKNNIAKSLQLSIHFAKSQS
jgi:hypothetical protein